ncbi:hypothetical protein [Pukyongiella litopenaei]|uniref:Alkylhydroperoxidase n=1 Tax=Pukyongiella litopenaei TaxID=2605946 RepID=A0A2S0MN46_9RHOB|nr:hypothetical protein [Pukyongiella litopenaei]AVO37161.1 hypothetical protein C6Y53_05215 [Pukyongiella litopenaei]
MTLHRLISFLIGRAEKRLGVTLDYTREIAGTDLRLLFRYNRIFGFLDPNNNVPVDAYHVARLRGALAADCGECVKAEINLARSAGLSAQLLDQVVSGQYATLPAGLAAVATLADSVAGLRADNMEAREIVRAQYGDAGLIELAFAMNGAALLPGIKRAMGYTTACDPGLVRTLVADQGR